VWYLEFVVPRADFASHNSGHGHDKSREIRPYANLPPEQRPVLFYAGDGVSDLSAAKETDLLFAKAGRGKQFRVDSKGSQQTLFRLFTDPQQISSNIVRVKQFRSGPSMISRTSLPQLRTSSKAG
jgi:2-hydroxy-3-keto-5-methylthiopentenyl-1-phosphate phosphatase